MNVIDLVHTSDLEVYGEHFQVCVYRREDGGFFSKTSFTDQDVIICDGESLEDTLDKHLHLLPLAVGSRRIIGEFLGFSGMMHS